MKSIWTEIFSVLKDIGLAFGGIATLILTVVGLGQLFGFDFSWVSNLGGTGIYISIITALLAAIIYSVVRLLIRFGRYQKEKINIEKSEQESAQKLSIELARSVEKSYKAKDYLEVVRFGSQLSRPLWLSGMLRERVAVGEMIEDAAAKIGMHEEQVTALIDDTGWTSAVLGNTAKAEENISHGIKLALEHQMFYFAAKGERHLAGICQRYKQDWQSAITHYENATTHARNIANLTSRDEMLAGILYGRAELLLTQGEFSEALNHAKESREIYQRIGGEEERLVKLHSIIGRIYLGLNNLQGAKDAFRSGFDEAQRLRRRDEIAINLLGLGEAHTKSGEHKKASETLAEATEIFEEIGMKQEAQKAKVLKIKADAEIR